LVKKSDNLIGKGNLVPDELINEIVQKEIKNIEQPFILNGFQELFHKLKFLDEIAKIGLVIYIEVSDETITQRILERGKTSNREDDQSVRIIERRLKQFKEETFPLIHFYKEKKILTYVDGERTIQEVFEQVQNILKLWS
jgi:adenylate kinase